MDGSDFSRISRGTKTCPIDFFRMISQADSKIDSKFGLQNKLDLSSRLSAAEVKESKNSKIKNETPN